MIKKKIVKICICLFSVILAGGMYSYAGRTAESLSVSAGAVYEPYAMTSRYKSGKYYKNLSSLTLSGDEARDVLAIAMSQVGYHEGNSDNDMNGESTSGTRDFVEYNVLAGKYDNDQGNGLSYGYYWCASFVNWCLRMAGVSEAASGSEVSCQRWYDDCKEKGIFSSRSDHIPLEGDIVFFRDEGSLVSSTHVGLVRCFDGGYIYTVEGNTSNGSEYSSNGEYVALKKHSVSSKYIVGYATPRYEKNTTDKTVDYMGRFFSLGDYIAENEIVMFSDSSLRLKMPEKLPAFSVFSVTEIIEGAFKIKFGDIEGYVNSGSELIQVTSIENVYRISYLSDDGNMLFLPQYRRAGEQKNAYSNAPTKPESGFVEWVMDSAPDIKLKPGDKLPANDGDITLVAVWDPNWYTVSFKNTDGSLVCQFQGYYGTPFAIPEPPKAPDGFEFCCWGDIADGVIRGNATYTANFVSNEEVEIPTFEDTSETKPTNVEGCMSTVSVYAVLLAFAICSAVQYFKKSK